MNVISRTLPKRNRDYRYGGKIREYKFIGVDGEGVTRPDGKHEYILLSVGDQSLYHPDGRELSWHDILPFLWQCYLDNPNATYVGFYLGYDFTQWLKHLPENRARMLLTDEGIRLRKRTNSGGNKKPFPVNYNGWHFDFLGLKRFQLWKCDSNKVGECYGDCNWRQRMYICDAGPYFQTSFLAAVEPNGRKWPDGAILTDVEYKKLVVGKAERGLAVVPYGTPVDPETIEYNLLENDVLARLMDRYNQGLLSIGISLSRRQFFGPGQAAQVWLNNTKAPTRESFEHVTDLRLRSHIRASYYGGWFEIFAHGHIPGESWTYDINSAYPDIQSRLPCCFHGTWTHGTDENPNGGMRLSYGTVTGTNRHIGAAPHRMRSGSILRPRSTKGWYWQHELDAARNAGLVDHCDVEEWINYAPVPCDCRLPFRRLRDLYLERLRCGKNSVGGKARRLVYNSTYGKTAQSIGVAKYANPLYASLITSWCRTYILGAIATHPIGASDVLMVATDGITFRHRHPNLHIDPEILGAWDETLHTNLCLFMPGIYWDDNVRLKLEEGTNPTLKSRGISSRALAQRITHIDAAFRDIWSGNGFPTFDIPISFAITSPKQALAWNRWETCGTVRTDAVRTINSDPYMKRNNAVYIDGDVIKSESYEHSVELESTPYNKTFGDDELRELDMIMSSEGDIDTLFAHTIAKE